MEPCIPLPLPDDILNDLVEKSRDWALMHGACMRSKTNFSKDILQFAPFLLLPSPFPRTEYERAVAMQPLVNELTHRVAHDYEFLKTTLRNSMEADNFVRRLFDVCEMVRSEGLAQPISLGMIRSDIMLDSVDEECNPPSASCMGVCRRKAYCTWKQVEVNTIAAGFGWLGPVSGDIHRYTLSELGHRDKLVNLPKNQALEGLACAMLDAWKIYDSHNAVILFVIEEVSYNICDQRFHEFEIRRQNPDVRVIRATLTDVGKRATLTKNKALFIDGLEIAVVYFRAGYTPDHYPSELEWEARLTIERSRAIKSPSIQYHLAGTKKIQQELAKPGVLQRFISDPAKIDSLTNIFTGLYSLDFGKSGDAAIEAALANPSRYVLKPQREGGGNNMYGENIRTALLKMKDTKERQAWILMNRIQPPIQKSYMVRPGSGLIYDNVISELGIFGVIIGDAKVIIKNQEVGHMLRTKLSTADEGGVAAGLGALDSLYLVDVGDCNGCK